MPNKIPEPAAFEECDSDENPRDNTRVCAEKRGAPVLPSGRDGARESRPYPSFTPARSDSGYTSKANSSTFDPSLVSETVPQLNNRSASKVRAMDDGQRDARSGGSRPKPHRSSSTREGKLRSKSHVREPPVEEVGRAYSAADRNQQKEPVVKQSRDVPIKPSQTSRHRPAVVPAAAKPKPAVNGHTSRPPVSYNPHPHPPPSGGWPYPHPIYTYIQPQPLPQIYQTQPLHRPYNQQSSSVHSQYRQDSAFGDRLGMAEPHSRSFNADAQANAMAEEHYRRNGMVWEPRPALESRQRSFPGASGERQRRRHSTHEHMKHADDAGSYAMPGRFGAPSPPPAVEHDGHHYSHGTDIDFGHRHGHHRIKGMESSTRSQSRRRDDAERHIADTHQGRFVPSAATGSQYSENSSGAKQTVRSVPGGYSSKVVVSGTSKFSVHGVEYRVDPNAKLEIFPGGAGGSERASSYNGDDVLLRDDRRRSRSRGIDFMRYDKNEEVEGSRRKKYGRQPRIRSPERRRSPDRKPRSPDRTSKAHQSRSQEMPYRPSHRSPTRYTSSPHPRKEDRLRGPPGRLEDSSHATQKHPSRVRRGYVFDVDHARPSREYQDIPFHPLD